MKQATILVVEDDVTLNEAYELILKNAGYNIVTAFDGQQALKKIENIKPDLIFLDLRMPIMDGVDFLKNYSAKKAHPDTKIIVFSNYDSQQEIDQVYKLGADRYILKAWTSPKELLKIVETTLEESPVIER